MPVDSTGIGATALAAAYERVLTIQVEDGFPTEQLPDLAAWDVRRYGRNILMFRVKGEDVAAEAAVEA